MVGEAPHRRVHARRGVSLEGDDLVVPSPPGRGVETIPVEAAHQRFEAIGTRVVPRRVVRQVDLLRCQHPRQQIAWRQRRGQRTDLPLRRVPRRRHAAVLVDRDAVAEGIVSVGQRRPGHLGENVRLGIPQHRLRRAPRVGVISPGRVERDVAAAAINIGAVQREVERQAGGLPVHRRGDGVEQHPVLRIRGVKHHQVAVQILPRAAEDRHHPFDRASGGLQTADIGIGQPWRQGVEVEQARVDAGREVILVDGAERAAAAAAVDDRIPDIAELRLDVEAKHQTARPRRGRLNAPRNTYGTIERVGQHGSAAIDNIEARAGRAPGVLVGAGGRPVRAVQSIVAGRTVGDPRNRGLEHRVSDRAAGSAEHRHRRFLVRKAIRHGLVGAGGRHNRRTRRGRRRRRRGRHRHLGGEDHGRVRERFAHRVERGVEHQRIGRRRVARVEDGIVAAIDHPAALDRHAEAISRRHGPFGPVDAALADLPRPARPEAEGVVDGRGVGGGGEVGAKARDDAGASTGNELDVAVTGQLGCAVGAGVRAPLAAARFSQRSVADVHFDGSVPASEGLCREWRG